MNVLAFRSTSPFNGMKSRQPGRLSLAFSLALCVLLAGFIPANAAPTFTVNSAVDAVDVNPGNGVCATSGGACTLRAAIIEANHTPGGGATVVVPPGTYTLSIVTFSLTDDETTGDLDMTASMTLVGADPTNTIIDGNGSVVGIDGVFEIFPGTTVTISGVTIRNGNVRSNFRDGSGGGILNNGTLTVSNSTLSGNNAPNAGGGIRNSGILTLIDSAVTGNSATSGGGIASCGTMGIISSTVSGNNGLLGAGVLTGGSGCGPTTLTDSTVSGNTVGNQGGGIYNSGTLTVSESTISGNTATGNNLGPGVGAGIYHLSGTLTLINSTISGNSASGSGAGISNGNPPFSGTVDIFNSTITRNTAGAGTGAGVGGGISTASGSVTTFGNTILAGNRGVISINPRLIDFDDCSGTIDSDGNNLKGIPGLFEGCTITGIPPLLADPQIGPLQDNGGPTQTHALLSGSPAIEAGACDLGPKPPTDQRGVPRPADGDSDGTFRCDIGAFEFVPSPPGPLAIGASALTSAEAGVSFTSDLMIAGGVPPYLVSISKGALPAGLSLGNDGVISGTVSPRAKSTSFTVRVTDSANESVSQTFKITVLKSLTLVGKLKTGRVGRNYNAAPKTKGGQGPFNWFLTGVLPVGLNFDTGTGAITGIPTQPGEFSLGVQVTDVLGGVALGNLMLTIR